MAEQCTVSIEDSKQHHPEQPAAIAANSLDDACHPASPLRSGIKSPTCCVTTATTATVHPDDEQPSDGTDGSSTPRTTCDHRSASSTSTTPNSGVTPLSLSGDAGRNEGVKKPYWLFSTAEEDRTEHRQQQQQQHHHLLRMDSHGSDDIDGSLRHDSGCPILIETPALERAETTDDGTVVGRLQSTTTAVEGMSEGSSRIGVVGKLAIISDKLAAVKPKRLSDEFFSADDDNDDEEDEDVDDEETKSNGQSVTDPNAMVDSEAQASLSEIKNLSITCCGKRKGEEEDEVEEKQNVRPSLCPSLAMNEQPKASVSRAIENGVEDDQLEHEEEGGQQQNGAAAAADEDEELLLDDVQSMDAIERRDFEQEGGFLIRNRSLISGDRLNLEFLNNTHARPPSSERTQPEQEEDHPSLNEGSDEGHASSNILTAVETVPTSSCASATTGASSTTRTAAQHTTTPTSSRYQHKHDPHHHHHHHQHHHHHNHHHQPARDGKIGGKALVSSNGSDSFSSSYNRETENNSTTKFAVNKLTRNLSASLANCNDKKSDPQQQQDGVVGTTGTESNSTSPISSSFATSSSASSSCSSSSYSLYSASAAIAGSGGEETPVDAPPPAVREDSKPAELAEAFMNANSNDSVSSDRSLFGGVHGAEEETALTVSDVQTKVEDTHTHHDDPCSSTASTASYSSSSSPSPSQPATTTQQNDDVSMTICSSSVLPPTASHSVTSSVSSSHEEESVTVQDSEPLHDLEASEAEGSKATSTAATSEPSSCPGRKQEEDSEPNGDGKLSFSCAFSKDDGKMSVATESKQLLPSTSTNGSGGERSEQDGASKRPANGSQQQPSQQQHYHRRQFNRLMRAAIKDGEGTAAASSASSSRAVQANVGSGSSGQVGAQPVSNPPPAPEVVAASYHQQRDASTNTSNSPESSEPEIDEEDWADCEEGTDEEVCTCRDYTDEDGFASSEDELPSRDVDLSSYTHLDTISDDLLHDAQTPRLHRKRKLTENRTLLYGDASSPSAESLNYSSRKRLALDGSTSASATTASSTAAGRGSPGVAGAAAGTSTATTAASTGGVPPLSNGVIATTPRSSLRSPMNMATTPTSSTLGERKTPRTIIPTKDNPPPELSEWLMQFQRWTHVERLLAVDRLIEHCEPTQVRHMMKVIEPQFQRDFISLLPKELALQVLSYLEPKDLLRAAQTCRSWRFLADDNLLWKEKCKESGIGIEPSTDRPKRGRTGNMPPISSPWKAAYMRQHIIEMNWRSRPIRTAKVLKGHDDHVITCLQFCGNRIVSGSDDNTLKVWSAITGKCLRTLTGHTGGVWSSQMSGNIIISGSTDRTLRVWKADTGQCMHILHGHTSTVRCMHLHGNKVVSGSRDATLRVWDVNLGTCLHMLVGHLAAVRCVQYDGKLIVSGAYDYMVKVWNPERQECLHTLQGHTNRVYSLQFDGIHVVSGSLDTSIRVWDAETGSCKHALMGHQSLTSGMELRQNILVSGNADSTVKVWDIITGQCLQTLSGPNKHQSAVTCLQFNSRFVITSSDDGTVKLWDVKTGEFIRNLVALESGGSGGVVWRIRANDTKLICAVGSRNGTEETKLMVLDFDVEADILSIVTIASCLVSKVPQIQTVRQLQSAKGLSVNGLLMELCSYTVTMLYNYTNGYAFLSYLEYPILLVQEYVLIYYVLHYESLLGKRAYQWAALYLVVFVGFATAIIPSSLLIMLVPFTTPVGATSKVMQLIAILRSKDSQSVSLITWGISAFTNSTRIYTIMLDSGDKMLLANFGISTVLSSSVLLAAWYYKKPKKD
uniref:F-box/WD repeat-containing protein 7 n=1 Tax=Anopheles epiroticus TaxID=199890 RepID=A0A182PB69_9DIPT